MARRRREQIIAKTNRVSPEGQLSIAGRVKEAWEEAEHERGVAETRQRWHDMDLRDHERPTMPDKAPADLKKINETALTPNAKGIVDQLSQQLRVEGIRLADSSDNAPAWSDWMRNRMGSKQVPLVKAAFSHGLSYAAALPAQGRLDKKPTVAYRLRSALRMTAFYRDDFDEFPEFALDVDVVPNKEGPNENYIILYDEDAEHHLSCPEGQPSKLAYIDSFPHGMDLCPIQRFGYMDLDGNARGEIEPYMPLLQRIDQDTSDRLVLQRFASWVVRTIAGMKKPDPEIEEAFAAWLSVGDFLMSESADTKFGSLPASPMDGHIRAREADIRDLAFTSQVPGYRMLGLSDNIGAEAIAAADASLKRKMDEFKAVFGEQYESLVRLGGYAYGNEEIANDFTSRIVWAKTDAVDIQTMAQAITTLYSNGEGIPMEMMWERLEGWTQQDTVEAERRRELIRQAKEMAAMLEAAVGREGAQRGNDNVNEAGAGAPAGAGAAS